MYDHENIPPYERTDKYALIRAIIEAHDDNQELMEDWAEAWLNTWPYAELKKVADDIRGSAY